MVSPPEDRLAPSLVGRTAVQGVLGVAALALACNVGALAVPLFNMEVFNRVLTTRNIETLAALGTGLAVCLLAWAALDVLRGIALDTLAGQITRRLSLPLIRAVAAAPRPDIVAAEALTDLETVRGFISNPACMAPFDLVWTPILLLVLVALHWAFAALGALCVAVLLLMNVLGDAVSRREMLAANDSAAAALRGAANAVSAAEVVLALGMLPTLRRRWQRDQLCAAGLVHRAILRARAISATTSALRMAMTGAMVALGLVLALDGSTSGGSMVSANMILARLLMPFGQVAATRRKWTDVMASWRRIRALLGDRAPYRYADALPAPAPRLVIDGLSYVAPGGDRPLLRSVSFTVEPGEAIAIIGPSSSGKSTLLRVILGMLPPTAGGAYLDGTSTYLWEREDFARHVGYVPQRPALLDETVAENIARMQAPDLSAVIQAAKRAGVHSIIAALAQGYATPLAAHILSGGQRQRVAIARALYSGPRLLILDEPTAFLDQRGEADLLALLATLKTEGTTVLLVTHRPSLLAAVDKALVLRDGAVAQFGPRDEILQMLTAPTVRLVRAAPELAAPELAAPELAAPELKVMS